MSDVALTETPLWLQAGSYPARLDRGLIDAVWPTEGVVRGMNVVQRQAGANLSVDVTTGLAVIQGDDQTNQGKYLVRNAARTNVPSAAAPTGASQKRRDLLVVTVLDPNAGGAAGDQCVFRWVQGAPTTGTPTVPAVPNNSTPLADALLTNGVASITNANITTQAVRLDVAPDVWSAGSVIAGVYNAALPIRRYYFRQSGTTDGTNGLADVLLPANLSAVLSVGMSSSQANALIIARYDLSTLGLIKLQSRTLSTGAASVSQTYDVAGVVAFQGGA